MATIKVVCGIIFYGDEVLICRRKPEKSLGGYWEFPGGKVEGSEYFEESLHRELVEELDLNVIINNEFMKGTHEYDYGSIELVSYICRSETKKVKLIDHDQIEWVKVKDLLDWKLAPADIPIAKKLIEKYFVSNSEDIL